MAKEEIEAPPEEAGRRIAGLTLVTAGGKTFLGKKAKTQPKGPAHQIVLDDTMMLIIQLSIDPSAGGVRAQMTPCPVPPLQKPCQIKLWADTELDLSGDGEMGQFYSQLTGNTGLIIPGFG